MRFELPMIFCNLTSEGRQWVCGKELLEWLIRIVQLLFKPIPIRHELFDVHMAVKVDSKLTAEGKEAHAFND